MSASSSWSHLLRRAADAVTRALAPKRRHAATRSGGAVRHAGAGVPAPARHVAYPDHSGALLASYSPDLDAAADPGEIVWTWVPFEEDPARGKDRPVLVVAWDDFDGEDVVLALMLTSKDHSRNAEREARHGRVWMDIGAGPWDSKRRDSEVRLDRVLQLAPDAIRREGAVVDRALFDQVVERLVELHGRAT
ncbi:type II toxin-antitoxin system PemK/MazF family toxin [Cellulomonas composti]|uniref:type II toxin-antitoxin system PemK/MazF family toxin n=1 Tax=Cellulomonas composti TaxID=266130 RepID=UPI001FE3414F|nr:type II toxin-antitoxin system PemK/MazF family toxin [Cellulomonas composti]